MGPGAVRHHGAQRQHGERVPAQPHLDGTQRVVLQVVSEQQRRRRGACQSSVVREGRAPTRPFAIQFVAVRRERATAAHPQPTPPDSAESSRGGVDTATAPKPHATRRPGSVRFAEDEGPAVEQVPAATADGSAPEAPHVEMQPQQRKGVGRPTLAQAAANKAAAATAEAARAAANPPTHQMQTRRQANLSVQAGGEM